MVDMAQTSKKKKDMGHLHLPNFKRTHMEHNHIMSEKKRPLEEDAKGSNLASVRKPFVTNVEPGDRFPASFH